MKTTTKIMIGLILLAFIFLGMAMKEVNKCSENPLIYGANKMSTEETGNFSCFCSFTNPNYDGIYFNKENISSVSNQYSSSTELEGGLN